MPPFPKLEARQFDLVFLDPPRYSKSPFGVVDLINDYQALFAGAAGHRARRHADLLQQRRAGGWRRLAGSAHAQRGQAGREVRAAEWITPDADFPSPDGKHPLKIVALSV